MWVRQLGGDVHLEALLVRDDCVPQLQHGAASLHKCLWAKESVLSAQ